MTKHFFEKNEIVPGLQLDWGDKVESILKTSDHFILAKIVASDGFESWELANDLSNRNAPDEDRRGKWHFDLKLYDEETGLIEFEKMTTFPKETLEYIYDIKLD